MTYLFLSSLFWFAFACGRASVASKRQAAVSTLPTAWMLEAWRKERTKANPRLRIVQGWRR